jgi:flagellar secretion chaperone FliS
MNPYRAYQKSEQSSGWTRIDLLLAVYDKAFLRLDQAEAALKEGQVATAIPLISKAQVAVCTLAGGVRAGPGNDLGVNMLRLYSFVVQELTQPTIEKIESARRVLKNLRAGLEGIRDEANALERAGHLPSGDRLYSMQTTA